MREPRESFTWRDRFRQAKARTTTRHGIHVPEPQEIVAWIAGLRWRVVAGWNEPYNRILWGILLLAAVLRFSYLDLVPFTLEEARNLRHAQEMIDTLRVPLAAAPSAQGIARPPLITYLLVLPLLINRDPLFISGCIILFNIISIFILYLTIHRHYGLRSAIISALLLAASPWSIVFSRQISASALMIPCAVLLLYALCAALLDGNPWGWVAAGVVLGIMSGLGFSPLLLIPAILLILVLYPGRARCMHVLLGFCLLVLILIPYLSYQNLHRLADFRAVAGLLRHQPGQPRLGTSALQYALWLQSGRQLQVLAGDSIHQFHPATWLLGQLDWALALVFGASLPAMVILAVRAWSHWRSRQDAAKYVILALWLWVPLLLGSTQPTTFKLHHALILCPAGFVAMGLVLDRAFALPRIPVLRRLWWSPYLQLVLAALFLVVIVWQAYSLVYLFSFVARNDTSGGYGIPYRFWRYTVNLIRREAQTEAVDQVWVIARGADAAQDEEPAILAYLLAPQIEPVFLGQRGDECLLLPVARSGVYLLTREATHVEQKLQQLQATERGLVFFPGRQRKAKLQVVRALSVEEALALVPRRSTGALDVGLRAVGYDWPAPARPGAALTLGTYWTFQDVPDQEKRAEHDLFVQLVTPNGGRIVAQRQGFGLSERNWSNGLLLVQWFDLVLPPDVAAGEYRLISGLYRRSDRSWSQRVDEERQNASAWILMGSVRIEK